MGSFPGSAFGASGRQSGLTIIQPNVLSGHTLRVGDDVFIDDISGQVLPASAMRKCAYMDYVRGTDAQTHHPNGTGRFACQMPSGHIVIVKIGNASSLEHLLIDIADPNGNITKLSNAKYNSLYGLNGLSTPFIEPLDAHHVLVGALGSTVMFIVEFEADFSDIKTSSQFGRPNNSDVGLWGETDSHWIYYNQANLFKISKTNHSLTAVTTTSALDRWYSVINKFQHTIPATPDNHFFAFATVSGVFTCVIADINGDFVANVGKPTGSNVLPIAVVRTAADTLAALYYDSPGAQYIWQSIHWNGASAVTNQYSQGFAGDSPLTSATCLRADYDTDNQKLIVHFGPYLDRNDEATALVVDYDPDTRIISNQVEHRRKAFNRIGLGPAERQLTIHQPAVKKANNLITYFSTQYLVMYDSSLQAMFCGFAKCDVGKPFLTYLGSAISESEVAVDRDVFDVPANGIPAGFIDIGNGKMVRSDYRDHKNSYVSAMIDNTTNNTTISGMSAAHFDNQFGGEWRDAYVSVSHKDPASTHLYGGLGLMVDGLWVHSFSNGQDIDSFCISCNAKYTLDVFLTPYYADQKAGFSFGGF